MSVLWTVFAALFLLSKPGCVGCQNFRPIAAPHCYNTTTCPCCSVPCPSDGTGQCGGMCKDGYHGAKCYNICPYNCIRCKDTVTWGGASNCTMCKDGHFSTESLYQCQSNCSANCKSCKSNASHCTSCHDGYYLTESFSCAKCNEACRTCNAYTTCTSCSLGYFVNQVDELCEKCSSLCYSCNASDRCLCFNGCYTTIYEEGVCYENRCHYGCKPNFTSATLNEHTCDKCVDGIFGTECDTQCSENCKFGRCKRISGDCYDCNEGCYGQRCEFRCPMNCENSCEKASGSCVSCKYGLFGINCTLSCQKNCQQCNITTGSCQVCIDGFYSEMCEKICPEKCQNVRCNKTTGRCSCLSEYTGPTCEVRITTTSTDGLGPPRFMPAAQENYVGATVGLTLAAVVIIVGSVGVGVWCYRRRQHDSINENPLLFSITASMAGIEAIEKEITRDDAKSSKLAAHRSELAARLMTFQSGIPWQHTGNRPLFSIACNSSCVQKLEKEMARTDEQLKNLDAHRSELAARLMTLKSSMPYRNTDRADKVENRSYEMLQIVNKESLYSSLQ